MEITFTTLCENSVGHPGFIGEWGLSILVEIDGRAILFDTGSESAAVKNADRLGIDLKAIGTIILSHAHHDHTGGLREVLKRSSSPEIIAHPAVFEPKFKRADPGGKAAFNGLPFAREEIERAATLRLTTRPLELSDTVLTSGEIARDNDFESVDTNHFRRIDGSLRPDDFIDEQALIIKTSHGLVIVSGCAHRGIVNTISHARNITGEQRVHTVIGGTHLYPKDRATVDRTIAALQESGINRIGVSHCTGLPAAMQLSHGLKDRFFLNNTGHVHTMKIEE